MKDDAIVLRETEAIMQDLPHELRHDEEILDAVIGSLQQGQSSIKVRQDALEIAHMKLEAKVDKGFELVSHEFQKVRHEAELDRVHASYAKQEAQQAKALAEAAMLRTHEIATTAAVASAKAEGAKDIAKVSRWANFDPLTGMVVCGALVVFGMVALSRVEVFKEPKQPPQRASEPMRVCGVDVSCDVRPLDIPSPTRQVEPMRSPRGGV